MCADLPLLSIDHRQELVDDFDRRIVKYVRESAEQILGSYSVSDARHRPDKSMDDLAPDANASNIARTFKRTMRSRATRLQVEDESLTLEQEVRLHFEKVFVPSDHELPFSEQQALTI